MLYVFNFSGDFFEMYINEVIVRIKLPSFASSNLEIHNKNADCLSSLILFIFFFFSFLLKQMYSQQCFHYGGDKQSKWY